jgi:hypothetical protein
MEKVKNVVRIAKTCLNSEMMFEKSFKSLRNPKKQIILVLLYQEKFWLGNFKVSIKCLTRL